MVDVELQVTLSGDIEILSRSLDLLHAHGVVTAACAQQHIEILSRSLDLLHVCQRAGDRRPREAIEILSRPLDLLHGHPLTLPRPWTCRLKSSADL